MIKKTTTSSAQLKLFWIIFPMVFTHYVSDSWNLKIEILMNFVPFRQHGTQREWKFKKATPPTTHIQKVLNVSWISSQWSSQNLQVWIFEISWFLTIILNSPLYPMGKPKTSILFKRAIVEGNGVQFGTRGWYFDINGVSWPCSIQSYLGLFIWATFDFS